MTLKTLLVSDVDDVFLQITDFADTIIRFVGGDEGNVKTFTGIVTLQRPVPNHERGRGYDQHGDVTLSEETELCGGDAIKFNSERYEVKSPADAEHGMKTCPIYRYIPETRGAKVLRSGDL